MEKKKIIKKVLKMALVVITIFILLILIHTIKNYIIITNLQNKIADYSNSTNYHTKIVTRENDEIVVTMDYYKKDTKETVLLEKKHNGEISKVSMYNNGERTDIFWDNNEGKTAQLDSGTNIKVDIYNFVETENKWQTFLGSIFTNVKSTEYNGKECYIIKGFLSPASLTSKDAETYIEKDTGLCLKTIEGEKITERKYEFDKVDETNFVEPDISKYTLK